MFVCIWKYGSTLVNEGNNSEMGFVAGSQISFLLPGIDPTTIASEPSESLTWKHYCMITCFRFHFLEIAKQKSSYVFSVKSFEEKCQIVNLDERPTFKFQSL